ncbi:hypothetical protein Pcinc_008238 [Petrolisthes cinctipes]|uniref:Peptidase A2 domain-containing protein n=1 Tax=Petrolisthes cinctipes TaxID=88211 RepID=A0AAE1GDQ1_PETCI|nr:hypothetical protein Pcinc_008238 [Petrolisthes cinctipes]
MCFLGKRVERGSVRAPTVSCLNPRQQLLSLPSAVTTPGRRSLLWIQDRLSVMRFLIDTGAALSLVPAQGGHACTGHPSYNMVAANGTPITTYGIQSRHLALAPNHTFQWNFLVADAGQLILGADFLSSHDLLVDTKRHRLQHQPTKAYLPVAPCLAEFPFISHLHQESEFDTILSEFPLLFSMDPQPGKINHNIEQYPTMILLFLNTFHSPKRHPNLPPPHQHDKSAHLLLILFPTNTTPSPNHYPPLTSLHPHSKYSPTPLNLHIPQSIPPLKQIKPSVISTLSLHTGRRVRHPQFFQSPT